MLLYGRTKQKQTKYIWKGKETEHFILYQQAFQAHNRKHHYNIT